LTASDAVPIVAYAAPSAAPVVSVTTPLVGLSASVVEPAATSAAPIVKQFEQLKPYNGSTSHRSFRCYFERYSKVHGWTTQVEKAQHLALSLEGPAAEVLSDVSEQSDNAYELIWAALACRFGYLDEPLRAMRIFESRRQLENESLAAYEQNLRVLYRDAWPNADEVTKDNSLKHRFDEGFNNLEMTQFLRLHARTDDFAQTVARARQFQDAHESVKPRKPSVRLAVAPEHSAEPAPPGQLQPVLDGLQKILETVLHNRDTPSRDDNGCQTPVVRSVATGRRPSSPATIQRRSSPAPSATSSGGEATSSRVRFQDPPVANESGMSTGSRPPPISGNSGSRDDNYRHQFQPRSFGASYRPQFQATGNRPWRDERFNNRPLPPRFNDRDTGWRPRPQFTGPRYDRDYCPSQSPERSEARPPPLRQPDRPQSSDWTPRFGRFQGRRVTGCYVCGRYGCHSVNHSGEDHETPPRPASQPNSTGQSEPLNGRLTSNTGIRGTSVSASSPAFPLGNASTADEGTQTDLVSAVRETPIVNFLGSHENSLEDDIVPNCYHFAASKLLVKSPRVPVVIEGVRVPLILDTGAEVTASKKGKGFPVLDTERWARS